MTALSMIVQPHAAYLLTDTAFYQADGTVVSFGPKVTEVQIGTSLFGPPAKAAFALQGVVLPDTVKAVIAHFSLRDVADLIAALPVIVEGCSIAAREKTYDPAVGADRSMLLALALWDDSAQRPYGVLIGNETCMPVREGHMKPFTVVRMRNYVQQRATKVGEVDYSDPAVFNPHRDGGALLDDQRADPFGDDETRFTGIGGQGILTEISGAGVRYHLLRNWPDKVGERLPA